MNEIQVFNNDDFGSVRIVEEDGKILFCGADAAKALGYTNTRDAINRHCKEDGVVNHDVIDTLGRIQQAKFINEGNLYRLITHSALPAAEKFESWVFDEVLPSIRKTGSYSIQPEPTDFERMNAETANLNAKAAVFEHWMRLSDALDTPQHHQICAHYASGVLAGHPVLPLPKIDRSYSATEVASMLGITAHKVGMLANKHGLKTDQYGYWVMDKSAHSSKEVSSFRYNDLAVDFLRNLQ